LKEDLVEGEFFEAVEDERVSRRVFDGDGVKRRRVLLPSSF
jgi:hypothetical protein